MNQQQKKEAKKLPSFYIALCCCVLVIGIAGYFTERHNENKTSSVTNSKVIEEANDATTFSDDIDKFTTPALSPETSETQSVEIENNSEVSTDTSESIPVISQPQPIEDYTLNNPDVDETAIIVSSEQPAFIMPVSGNILEGYSDQLVFNNVLSDWRTHDGIDIAAEKGCSVQAAATGVIDSITEDEKGGCVIISHAAGFVTKYMGLENIENLTVGKEVQSSEVIGIVGECTGENTTDSHLHFEMTKDGNTVNPQEYLPQ